MAAPTALSGRLGPGTLNPVHLVVGLLICTDLVILVLHLAHRSMQVGARLPVVKSMAFNISSDHGIAESFGYVKLFWVVMLLLWLGFFAHRRSYLPWALLFGFLLADDLLGFHETVGTALVHALGDDPERLVFAGLRMQDLGELAFAGAVGLVLLASLLWGFFRGTARTRATYWRLLLVSLVLATFGLIVDGVATGVGDSGLQLLHLLEDGGELLAVTAVLACTITLVGQLREPAEDSVRRR